MWYQVSTPLYGPRGVSRSSDPVAPMFGFRVPKTTCPSCGGRHTGDLLVRVTEAAEARVRALAVPSPIPWEEWDGWRRRIAETSEVAAERIGVLTEIGFPRARLVIKTPDTIPDFFPSALSIWARSRVADAIRARGLRGAALTPAVIHRSRGPELRDFVEVSATTVFPVVEYAAEYRPCEHCARPINVAPFKMMRDGPTPIVPGGSDVDFARLDGTSCLAVSDAVRRLASEDEWTNVEFEPLR